MANVPPALRSPVWPAALAAALLAGAYLTLAHPPGQDLAAAVFRSGLFEREGFTDFNASWYSGHPVLSYSVLYPPAAALVGTQEASAVAVVVAAALFAVLVRRHFGERALAGALWFAAGAALWLLTGRMPFLFALPFGLAALLLADDRRVVAATAFAALTALASPVAGAFTALAGAALWLSGRRRDGAALALGGAVPIVVLNVISPVGGEAPLALSAFLPIPLTAAVALLLVPREHSALRIGLALYALVAVAALVVDNPLGGNVTRLGALFAGPVLAMALWPRGRLLAIAVCVPLLYWQLVAPARDVLAADEVGRADERAFYEPLLERLDEVEPNRVQVPPTRDRWEAAYVAPVHPLARGWLRQLEADDFELFTDGRLDAGAYREWLADHEVDHVAVADTKLDYLAEDEARLIAGGLPYLRPVWESADWKLYRVRGEAGG